MTYRYNRSSLRRGVSPPAPTSTVHPEGTRLRTAIIEKRIHEHVARLVDRLDSTDCQPLFPLSAVTDAVFRVILGVTVGVGQTDDVTEFNELIDLLHLN